MAKNTNILLNKNINYNEIIKIKIKCTKII